MAAMSRPARPLRFPLALIVLHWAAAMLVMAQLGLGLRIASSADPARATLGWHAVIGLSILLTALIRVAIRLSRRMPPQHRGWRGIYMRTEYVALYALMILTPLAGIAAWTRVTKGAPLPLFGLGEVRLPDLSAYDIHGSLALAVGALVAAHVFAVMCNFLLDGPMAVRRMLPGRGET
jgi:cytochrome b561